MYRCLLNISHITTLVNVGASVPVSSQALANVLFVFALLCPSLPSVPSTFPETAIGPRFLALPVYGICITTLTSVLYSTAILIFTYYDIGECGRFNARVSPSSGQCLDCLALLYSVHATTWSSSCWITLTL